MKPIGGLKPRVHMLEKELKKNKKKTAWSVTFVNATEQSVTPVARKLAIKYSLLLGS